MGGSYGEGEHRQALVVRVQARAVDGAATAAVVAAVAKAFDVRRSDVRLVTGATSRTKVLELDIDPDRGSRRLSDLLAVDPAPGR